MPDTLIRNGWIVDGSGAPRQRADLVLHAGRIVDIGLFEGAAADQIIEAHGQIVAPGFIDMHSHADFTLPVCPSADSLVQQGITTAVVGQCGHSMAPLFPETREEVVEALGLLDGPLPWEQWDTVASYFRFLDRLGMGLNVAPLLGHGITRAGRLGFAAGGASPEERRGLQAEVAAALAAGAFGVSTGLIYPPGSFSSTEELIDFVCPVARQNGLYFSHLRDEGDHLLEAVAEAIRIGTAGGVRVQISHFKAAFPRNWGKAEEALGLIDQARAAGLDITADMYPYLAGGTYLKAVIPDWAHEGGAHALLNRLRSPAARQEIIETSKHTGYFRDLDWEAVILATAPGRPDWENRSVPELAAAAGQAPWEWVFDALLETKLRASIVYFMLSEANLCVQLRHPAMMIGTDGEARALTGPMARGLNHPRSYGAFPRVLSEYVRKQQVLTFETAIHKMTGLPAQKLRLRDRGLIGKGLAADLVIFDPETITDLPTYANPYQSNPGIAYVFVNGICTLAEGRRTGALPGKRLSALP